MKISRLKSLVKSISIILAISIIITTLPVNAVTTIPLGTQTAAALSAEHKITGEIESKRDRFTKTFLCDDSSLVSIVSSTIFLLRFRYYP